MNVRPRRLAAASCTVLLLVASSLAQSSTEPELLSGPAAGVALPVCNVYAPSGPFAGTEFDAAARLANRPGVLLFVNELTRNTAPMISGLDRLAAQLAWTGLETHTIRIAADRNEAEAAVKRGSDALHLYRPILVSPDGVDGPGGYALHRKATLTLVLANNGVVVRSVPFTDTGRADLGRLRSLVEQVTGPIPTDAAKLRAAMEQRLTRDPERLRELAIELALQLQRVERNDENRRDQPTRGRMQGQDPPAQGQAAPSKPREGKPPTDDELRALLRRAIQKAADADELDAVYQAIDARVGDDEGLRAQVREMFKLQISLGYGNEHSLRRARAYLEEHRSR